ncbi:crispr-associated protein [Lacticaseibacillus brantae DSM 23927]|uniref:Crispr-associated protein n=1 Tax=Lacticaseibacillus brantae DSM 23927 TaxID=1423727 RepID=A0A0R2AYU7_9LACO|nr:crispr-associated protein [Lacticaseibacillus brantae DSM 23927]
MTDPWINVIDNQSNQEVTVSLSTLFQNAQHYRQLAGEMQAQDLAILRLLLAILTTVYSRFNANGEPYDWLTIQPDTMIATPDVDQGIYAEDAATELLTTWDDLHQAQQFSDVVQDYLTTYQPRFDLFGDQPFYQATTAGYDAAVPDDKKISLDNPKGTVGIKQINRRISESGNSVALFSPRSGATKDNLTLPELSRWLITYQNFTGVTDKTKIVATDKFSAPLGWLYSLNPIYAIGKNLFETLMLNLVLLNPDSDAEDVYHPQQPVWEVSSLNDYLETRKSLHRPDNLAELYTTWSRLIHVEWDESDYPIIFSASIPQFSDEDMFIEPMTTWRYDKKTEHFRPAIKGLRNMNRAMWRNFGSYVRISQSQQEASQQREPGIVSWLRYLREESDSLGDNQLTLASATLIRDDNATSQMPAAELADEMRIDAAVFLDDREMDNWAQRIEEVVDQTQKVGDDYRHFISNIADLKNRKEPRETEKAVAQFYDQLNEPFLQWLASLTIDDDVDSRIWDWRKQLHQIALDLAKAQFDNSTPREITGVSDGNVENIFTEYNRFMRFLNQHLDLSKKGD